MLSNISIRYWSVLVLLVWGGMILGFGLVRFDSFGLDEGGAMALLLGWSVSDQIATPVALYGGPDFRVLPFYLILGLYWPGSMVAAKVFSIIVMFLATLGLYRWSKNSSNDEVAMLASGLLLIAPVSILQIDSLSVGPYLLLLFAFGALLNEKYRHSAHSVSSLYFVQILLIAFSVSLHPAGLAYPLALAWHWYKHPSDSLKQQQFVWLGSAIATLIVLVMQTGWIGLTWFANPIPVLHNAIIGHTALDIEQGWIFGIIFSLLSLLVCIRDYQFIVRDLLASMLLIGSILGLLAANDSWALLLLVFLLYRGIPQLIQLNKAISNKGFAGQRGLVLAALLITSFLFMQGDKSLAFAIKSEVLSPTDQLLQTLSTEASDVEKPFFAASQWPARTMMICKRDSYRLPPTVADGQTLLKSIKGISHVVFNHQDPQNSMLARNLSEISNQAPTLAIQDGGVIIKLQHAIVNTSKKPPVAPASKSNNLPPQ